MKFFVSISLVALLMGSASSFVLPSNHRTAFNGSTAIAMSSEQRKKVDAKRDDITATKFEGTEKDDLDMLKKPEKAFIDDFTRADSPDLEDLLVSQLLGSMSMYTFAKVREYVRNNPDKNWYRPELILTQRAARDGSVEFHRFLRHPVSVAAQYEFVANPTNWAYLKDCEDVDTEESSQFNIRDTLNTLQRRVNVNIVEFDDQFADKDLVYGITVNRTNKRITVLFRGSVFGGRDWPTNANALYKTLKPTPALANAKLTKDIKVHRGFQSYLFAEEPSATPGFTEKFDQIVGNIRELYAQEEFKGFRFVVAGHSLGGALTQLLAYHLASSGKIKDVIPDRPITAISFASPQVGNEGYNQAFQELERQGLVHHLRISNQGDVVPVGPFGWGYTQTGLHMHLKPKKEMEVGYRNLKSQISQFSLDAGENHSLNRYYERLMIKSNNNILDTDTIKTLYDQHAGDFTE